MRLRRHFSIFWRKLEAKYKLIGVIVIVGIWFIPGNPTVNLVKVLHKDTLLGLSHSRSLVNIHDGGDLHDMDKLHIDRRNFMIKACAGKEDIYVGNNSIKTLGEHIVVDRKHKLIYCWIEKVGSTFWRRVFQIIVGSSKSKSPFEIPGSEALGGKVEKFATIAFDDAYHLLKSFKKFTFVRNPYTRLFSAYIDKLFSPNPTYWTLIGKHIIQLVRKNPSNLSLECGHDVTFSELLKYFIHSETHNESRDAHFIPMYDHCRPCRIKYDYIGKMESFKQDTLYFLQKFGFYDLFKALINFDQDTLRDTISDQVDHLFGYRHIFTKCISFHEALKRYWIKFQIRGFLNKNVNFPFSENQSNNLTRSELIKVLAKFMNGRTDKNLLKEYKEQAITDAYLSLDIGDLYKLREILQPDCNIFGYDCSPKKFFKRQQNLTN